MRLSQAIRLGAMLKPQAFRKLVAKDGSTCAVGAAFDAIGINAEERQTSDLMRRWPLLALPSVKCPACPPWRTRGHMFHDDMYDVITDLNDDHHWTREQIADFVEQIELAQEQKQNEPATPETSQAR